MVRVLTSDWIAILCTFSGFLRFHWKDDLLGVIVRYRSLRGRGRSLAWWLWIEWVVPIYRIRWVVLGSYGWRGKFFELGLKLGRIFHALSWLEAHVRLDRTITGFTSWDKITDKFSLLPLSPFFPFKVYTIISEYDESLCNGASYSRHGAYLYDSRIDNNNRDVTHKGIKQQS
jgi:hypothetical protein